MVPFIYLFSIVIFFGGFFPWMTFVDFVRELTKSDILAQITLGAWYLLLLAPFVFHYYSDVKADKNKSLGIEEPQKTTSQAILYIIGGIVTLALLPTAVFLVTLLIFALFGGRFE